MTEQSQKIEIPVSARKREEDEIDVHVMPKEFFGKDVSVSSTQIIEHEIAKVPTPIAPVPAVAKAKISPPKKRSKFTIVIVAIGIIAITVFSVGGYFVIKASKAPVETPEEPNVPNEPIIPIEPEPSIPVVRIPSQDTDSDGITDIEEALYGTDFRNPDSDGDSFLDGNEVFHGYDPLGFAPSTLLLTGSVVEYETKNGYTFLYPKMWTASEASESRIVLQSNKSTQIVLSIEDMREETDLRAWYLSSAPDADRVSDVVDMMSKQGYVGLESQEGHFMILQKGSTVYRFTYEVMNDPVMYFGQTFKMIVNSFRVQP